MDDVLVYRGAVELGYGIVIIHRRSKSDLYIRHQLRVLINKRL